jgi:hypothetical protein
MRRVVWLLMFALNIACQRNGIPGVVDAESR